MTIFLVKKKSMIVVWREHLSILISLDRFFCYSANFFLVDKPPSLRYGTFNDVFKRRWADILRFRAKSLFTTCEVCSVLKQQLGDKNCGLESKLQTLKHYRAHLHSQYCDRACMWQLQSASAEPESEVLFISTDGLDQAKFALPRHPDLRANAAVYLGMVG